MSAPCQRTVPALGASSPHRDWFEVTGARLKAGEPVTLTGGLAFMGLGLVTQGLSPVWPVAILGFALVCIGQSICFPNLTALISQAAPAHRQGEMMGLNPGAPFAFAALLVLPALWFAAQVRRRLPRVA